MMNKKLKLGYFGHLPILQTEQVIPAMLNLPTCDVSCYWLKEFGQGEEFPSDLKFRNSTVPTKKY